MDYPSVHHLGISTPKKDGSTYSSQIYYEKRKNLFKIDLENVFCFYKNGNIYIKNKQFMLYMIDIGTSIVDTVKQNCDKWFNNNMNIDLVEDYYDSPLTYDKKYGQVIRIKTQKSLESFESGRFNIIIHIQGIRFSKQKFNIEFSIHLFEPCNTEIRDNMFHESNDDYISSEEDDDIAEPIPEDINNIRNKHIQTLNDIITQYNNQINEIKKTQENLEHRLININSEISNIIKIKEQLNDIMTISELEYITNLIQNLQV